MPLRSALVEQILNAAWEAKRPITAEGVVEVSQDGWGLLTYTHDSYRVKPLCAFVPKVTMKRWGLKRGHIVKGVLQPPRKDLSLDGNRENCPVLLNVETIMGRDPALNLQTTIFEELTPYYPTERFLLETSPDVKWDNVSMRVVDLLTPVGKGQRGLIVAPPRTGKTILQQGIANAIMRNNPESHLIVLLVDERPEEVTDFRRQIVKGEVVASTFDENAESHVHAAEMVIEKARRMVEVGRHVVILLDSITRLARAYNALAGNSGKILSGGVEATAMQKPKRFFGSARNIEGGGSLTILGTALVETGSRMDEVIFEEFKGTGNMELVLDRELVNKRIFPAINLEKSGTRKEELLYHPDEMVKVYGLRRAMKGVPSPDAMEMLITRVKKTKTNIEFLMGLNR
jgi:transcription termination factor Rho